jgi:hypothetical protein
MMSNWILMVGNQDSHHNKASLSLGQQLFHTQIGLVAVDLILKM